MCTSAYGWPENRVRNTGASLRTVGPNRVWPQVLPGHECCTCCLLLEGCEHAHRVVATESKRVGDTSSDLMLDLAARAGVHVRNLVHQVVLVQGGVEVASLDGLDSGDGLHATCCSQAVPDQRLGAVHFDVLGVLEHALQGLHLRDVAHQRACGVGIDVVDLLALNACVPDGCLNACAHAQAIRSWVSHVVRIAGDSTSKVLCQDLGASLLGVLQALHH
mmetsp:Transcript_6763/g.18146  ORF Transcript_6763/g.18146 Transcript_6763/m.18146 type:complete len:219 (-) Transcript_6763:873-1529(-)